MCIYVNSHATIFTLQMASAPEPTSHYTEDSLQLAIQDVRCSKLSLRMAARQYGIPKSTLSLYVAVPGRNRTLFRCVFRSHCCV